MQACTLRPTQDGYCIVPMWTTSTDCSQTVTSAMLPSMSSAFVKGPHPHGGSLGINEIPKNDSFLGIKVKARFRRAT